MSNLIDEFGLTKEFIDLTSMLDEFDTDSEFLQVKLCKVMHILDECSKVDYDECIRSDLLLIFELIRKILNKDSTKVLVDKTILHSDMLRSLTSIIKGQLILEHTDTDMLLQLFKLLLEISVTSTTHFIGSETVKCNLFDLILQIFNKCEIVTENCSNNKMVELYDCILKFVYGLLNKSASQLIKQNIIYVGLLNKLFKDYNQLKTVSSTTLRPEISYIQANLVLVIADLLNESELNNCEIIDDCVNMTVMCLKETIKSSIHNNQNDDHHTKYYTIYRIGEQVMYIYAYEQLRKLLTISSNDKIKQILFDVKILDVIEVFLRSGNNREISETCELICSLCFNQEVKAFLKGSKLFMGYLYENLKKTNEESTITHCQLTIDMIKDKILKRASINRDSGNITLKDGHILISCHHIYKVLCLEICVELNQKGYKTYIDVDATYTDLYEAIEKSSLILVCYSREYKESSYCRYEIEYAKALCKKVIAVRMEPEYTPDGWLKVALSSMIQVDFTENKDASFNHLLHSIKNIFESETHVDDHVSKIQRNPKMWNKNEVREWLIENNLMSLKIACAKYTGSTLYFLWKLLKEDHMGFMNTLNKEITSTNAYVSCQEKELFHVKLNELFSKFY